MALLTQNTIIGRSIRLLILICAVAAITPAFAASSEGRFLAREEIILYGMGLSVEPVRQVVPKNIATIVSATVRTPSLPEGTITPLGDDALLKGTLRGPGLEAPLELSVRAGSPFTIPPLTVPGIYTLDGIRIERGGEILFRGSPESVIIEIIEKLLVTQVTARPLTAQEIRDKGIVFDPSSFRAYNFTAAFAVTDGSQIVLEMPVVLPQLSAAADLKERETNLASLPEPQMKDLRTIIPDSLKLAQTRIPNLTVRTFGLELLKYEGNDFVVPPIPGVIVIPGDIGFLNQFFSVMLLVGNAAPEYSGLVVRNLTATMLLPGGSDRIVGTADDPLRMATTTQGPSSPVQAVVQPGPDGRLGTADDLPAIAPGESGNAEFLVEGLREGSHTLEMALTGTLEGLPVGPVTVTGRTAGTVLVRNPNFTLTFTHPEIVTAGEEYTLDVTVTNTSPSPANFVSVNLHPGQISGAELVGEGSQQIENIPPGDAATVSFSLRSRLNGTVFAATLDADEQIAGRFALKTSVGELGIPLSPDSLILPKEAGSLPKSLRDASLGLLGRAYAVATAPAAALPRDLVRFGKKIVWDRGIEVAEAGFRHSLHEPLPQSALQLLFDFMGSNYPRLGEFNPKPDARSVAEADYAGFDDLRRRSVRGDALAGAVASLLEPELSAKGAASFQYDLASLVAYRPGHVSVLIDGGGRPLPVSLTLLDSRGRRLGGEGANGKIIKEIPYGDYLTFPGRGESTGRMAIIAVPEPGAYRIRLERLPGSDPATPFTLGIVAPAADGTLQQRIFSGVTAADLPLVDMGDSPHTFSVELVRDGALQRGAPLAANLSRAVADLPPAVISVVQQPELDKIENICGTRRFGRVVAALFSEEVTAGSVQDRVAKQLLTRYALEGNQVVGVALQPGRRIAFLALRDPVGPFVPRSITFSGISDRRGNTLDSQTVPIEATIQDQAAVVSGSVLQADGTLLAGAEVRLFTRYLEPTEDGCTEKWAGVSAKRTGSDASFGWDYVLKGTDKVIALNQEDGEYRSLLFSPARNGQRLNLNVVFFGRGTVGGKILGEDGITPLAGAEIRITSLTDNSTYGAVTDATGRYGIPRVPVGSFIIEAVHTGTSSRISQSGHLGAAGAVVELNLVLLTEARRKVTVRYGSAAGAVLRPDGATVIASAPVYAFYQDNSQEGVRCPPIGPGERPPECAVGSAATDAAGGYAFPELPAGSYRLYAFDQAAFQEGNARIIVPPDGGTTANILLNGGFATIRGIVKDADGTPVAGAEVGGGVSLATTDADGIFTLTDVPLGSRRIVAVSRALMTQGSTDLDISVPGREYGATIILQAQGGIYGTVLTAGRTPAVGMRVNLIRPEGDGFMVVASTVTGAGGAYQFPNVPVAADEYTVSAFLPDLSDGGIARTFIRFQGERVRVDLTFRGKGRVSGGIVAADGVTPLAGRVSVSGLRVVAARHGDELFGVDFAYTPHLQIVDTTISSNRFSFNGVFVGPFVVTAAGPFSPDPVTFKGELSAPGEERELTIRLTPTSVITGTVYGPDGVTPQKNALVTYRSDEYRTICGEDEAGEESCTRIPQGIQNETAVSDDSGRFTLPLVNAGKFTLTVEERDAGGNPTGRVARLNGLVQAGQTADLAVRMPARAPVRVEVYAHDAVTPVPNAWVTVTEMSRLFENAPPRNRADGNGVLLLTGLDAVNEGSFTVLAESNDGFVGRGAGRVTAEGEEVTVKVYLFDHTVTVRGTVHRPDGITPVPNAEVAIANAQGDLAFAVTNAAGEYSQEYIPLGPFRIEVFEAATGRRGFATATATLSAPVMTVNVRELAIGQVQGTILQAGSLEPLPRWQVTLSGSGGMVRPLVATTGVDGRFVIPGVPAGEFRLTASLPGERSIGAQGFLTREGEVIEIPLVALLAKPERGTISGWVYRPGGTPGADSTVCLNPSRYGCDAQTTADADGRFTFADIRLGRFAILAGSQVTRESGTAYGDLPYAGGTAHVRVVLEGVGTVSGTVVDGSEIVPGARVVLEKFPEAGCGGEVCTTYADPVTGRFSFPDVPAGLFSLRAEDPANVGRSGSAGGLLTPGGTSEVTLPLADTGSLRIKVLLAGGSPAPGVIAELRRGNDVTLYRVTADDGVATFSSVPKGEYILTLNDPAGTGLARKTLQIVTDHDLTSEPLLLDESPPSVLSIAPLPGEIRVPLDSPIVITFSEPVQPGSISAGTISVTSPDGEVSGFRTLSVNDTVVTFTPLSPLKDETLYTIRVSGVRDRLDREQVSPFSATFATVDVTPPAIVGISPAPGSGGAPLESVIRVLYGEPVSPTSFTGQAITVSDGTRTLPGRVDMILGNTGMVFTPTYPLAPDTPYTVTLLPASDLSGNRQDSPPPFTFSTLDRTPPVITSLNAPATVVENGTITVTPVLPAGHDIAVVDWYLNGAPAGSVRGGQNSGYSFTFTALPTLGIPGGPPIRVTAVATDTSGNRAVSGTDVLIGVTADLPPSVVISAPSDGSTVRNSERVVVRVDAADDRGVSRIAYQAVGGKAPAAETTAIAPPENPFQREYVFYVPEDAVPGSSIVINATAVDSTGKSSAARPVTLTVTDAVPPVLAFAGVSSGDLVRPGQNLTLVVSASDHGGVARVTFRANGGAWAERIISPPQNSVAATFTHAVPVSFTSIDQVRLEAMAFDAAGNVAQAPAVILPVADTVPPRVALRNAAGSGSVMAGGEVTIVVDAEDDTTVTGITLTGSGAFTFGDTVMVPPAGRVEKSFIITIPAQVPDGALLTFSATAVDASGNVSTPASLTLGVTAPLGVQLPPSQIVMAGDDLSLPVTLDRPAPAGGVLLDLSAAGENVRLQPLILVYAEGESVQSFTLSPLLGGTTRVAVSSRGSELGSFTVTVRGGIVSGRVVNSLKEPVPGARVVVNGSTVTAGSDGTFLVEGIAGPDVTVNAFDADGGLQGVVAGLMNGPNGFLRGLTVTVTAGGRISGVVRQADQNAAGAGVRVDLFDPANPLQALLTTFTAADGSYSFPQVPLGTFTVDVRDTAGNRGRSTAYLTTSGGEAIVTVTFLGRGTVTGTIRDPSGGVIPALAVTIQESSIFGSVNRTVMSDETGRFTFPDVSVGTFILSALDSVSNLGATASGTITLHGQTVTADLNLGSWASLEGYVYRSDGTTPAAGVAVKAGGLQTTSDVTGAYRFEVLPLGYYSIEANDPTTRSKGVVALGLQTHRENRRQNLVLSGNARMIVTVLDGSGNAVPDAKVILTDGYGILEGTADADGTFLIEHVYPGSFSARAALGLRHGSATGSVAADEQAAVAITIAADPSGVVAGTVYAPDGQTPAVGATVTVRQAECSSPFYCQAYRMTTAGDGTFRIDTIPLGDYDLLVSDARGQLRAKQGGIVLDSDGRVEIRTLTMIGLGTVTGRVLEPNSSTGAPDTPVTVRALHPDFGRSFSVRTNAAGFYQVELVPAGPIAVSAGDVNQQKLGDAAGSLPGDGVTLTLDVALQSNAVTLPQTLYDANGLSYSIRGDGTLPGYAFGFGSGAGVLEISAGGSTTTFAAVTTGTQEQQGREIALRRTDLPGVAVTRKIHVPQEGYFARYLEIIDNLGESEQSVTVTVRSSLYSAYTTGYTFTVDATSSGDRLLQNGGGSPDYWVTFDNSNGSGSSLTRSALIWGGAGGAVAGQAAVTPSTTAARELAESWALTIPAGGRAAIMHFVVQSETRTGAIASAQRLVQLPPEALAGLSQDELLAIRNFPVPLDGTSALAALPPLTGTVTVDLMDGTGASLTGVDIPVSIRSTDPIFFRTFTRSTTSGRVTFTSGSGYELIPLGPYTVSARREYSTVCGNYYCTYPTPLEVTTPGSFAPGSTLSVATLALAPSGNAAGYIRTHSGEPVPSVSLALADATRQLVSYSSSDGGFLFRVVPPGEFSLRGELNPTYSDGYGTPISVSRTVTVTAGQTAPADVALPPLGRVQGQLLGWSGTPLAYTTVSMRTQDNSFQRSITTDSGGNFSLGMIPPGSYRLQANDPATGALSVGEPLTMVNGESITRSLTLARSGRFSLSVQYADGSPVENGLYNHSLEVRESAGDTLAYSQSSIVSFPAVTSPFASNAERFRGVVTQSYYQPGGGGALTATGETTVDGFSGADSTPIPVTVRLPINRGTVTVQLKTPGGMNYAGSSIPVELWNAAGTARWGSCRTDSATGSCSVSEVAVDAAGLLARAVVNGVVIAEAADFMLVSGQTQTVALTIPFDPVAFPKHLYDGNGMNVDLQADGTLRSGKNYVFDQSSQSRAMTLLVAPAGGTPVAFAGSATGIAEDLGREVSTTQSGLGGLNVTRKIYVPADGYFARYLDLLTNPGDQPVTVDVGHVLNYSSYTYDFAVRIASDGGSDPLAADRDLSGALWAVVDDGSDLDPFLVSDEIPATALVWAGSGGGILPADVRFTRSTGSSAGPAGLKTSYRSVTIPAGSTVALMTFLVQQTNTAAARASAERLVQLPPEALSGLSQDELLAIRNFPVPADGTSQLPPLPPLNGTITGTVRTFDGVQTPIPGGGATVMLRSSSPYFARTYRVTTGSTGVFTFAGNPTGLSTAVAVPVSDFTLQGAVSLSAYTVTSPPVNGSFTAGTATAQQDVPFTNTGRLAVTLLTAEGTPVTNAELRATYGVNCQSSYCPTTFTIPHAGEGSYPFEFVQEGQHNLTATIPPPPAVYSGGTPLVVTGSVNAARGVSTPYELRLPPLGSIAGTVTNRSGTAVANNLLYLYSKTNDSFYRTLYTYNGANGGAAGSYLFAGLPAGEYRLEVYDTVTYGVVYRYDVTVTAGEVTRLDCQYGLSGTVRGIIAFRTATGDPAYVPDYATIEIRDQAANVVLTSLTAYGSTPFTTARFSGTGRPLTLKASYRYSGTETRTYAVTIPLADFSSDGQQIDAGTITLPVDRGNVRVLVADSDSRPITGAVTFQLRDGSGVLASYISSGTSNEYTFTNVYTDQATLTARVIYLGTSIDAPVSFVPNGTATVTVTVPLATVNGRVFAGDGATPLTFTYRLTTADGSVVYPCGSSASWRYYWYSPGSVYRFYLNDSYDCTSSDGSWGLNELVYLNPTDGWYNYTTVPRRVPIQNGTSLKLRVTHELGTFEQLFTYDGTLPVDFSLPLFVATGSVNRGDSTPVAGASVTMVVTEAADPPQDHTYAAATDTDGRFTIIGGRLGSFTLNAQTDRGAMASFPGGGSVTGFSTPVTGLDMVLEPTGSISGTVTRGGIPLPDALVLLYLPDRTLETSGYTDAGGSYVLTDIPLGDYAISAGYYDPGIDGTMYSPTVNGTLTAGEPNATVDFSFDFQPGTLYGTVQDRDGNPLQSQQVTVTMAASGEEVRVYTDASGMYFLSGLPSGGYVAFARSYASETEDIVGSSYGILPEGGALRLDLTLRPELSLPRTLTSSSDPFVYGIDNGGSLSQGGAPDLSLGSPFSFEQLYQLADNPPDQTGSLWFGAAWMDDTGQLVFSHAVRNGKVYQRKAFLPPGGGYLRYLERVFNPSAEPITVKPYLSGTLAAPASGAWSYLADPLNGFPYALNRASDDPAMPVVGMVLQGTAPQGAFVQSDVATPDQPAWYWETTAPGGGSACIMHFLFQGSPTDTTLEQRAQALSDLDGPALTGLGVDPDPLAGLTADERSCIGNFTLTERP